jgi:CDP-diacylglycerol--glycerol-3-phosphate 3-phosphatidyltransferase
MSLIPVAIERPFDRGLDELVRVVARTKINPNSISILGFVLNLTAALLLFNGMFVLAGILILFAGMLDMTDGKVARLTGKASIYGAIFDATLDRIGELAIYTGIGAYLVVRGLHLTAFVTVLAIGGSILISYVRARAESYNIPCSVGILRRGERILLFGLGATLNFLGDAFHEPFRWLVALFNVSYKFPPMPITLVLLAIAILSPITIVQRLLHIKTNEAGSR